MKIFKRIEIAAIAVMALCNIYGYAFPSGDGHEDTCDEIFETTVTLPEVVLKNDTIARLVYYEVYPVFEQLCPETDKVLKASWFDSTYALHMVTPMEYPPFGFDDDHEITGLIGYFKIENIFVLLSKSFSQFIDSYTERRMHFSLKIKYTENESVRYCEDPWELYYVVKPDGIYTIGNQGNYIDASPRSLEWDKQLIESMSGHEIKELSPLSDE